MDENLLKETLECMRENAKEESDVIWVQTNGKSFTWEEFKKSADFEYNSGFGTANVDESLMIVGTDWWMERHEYDGSEWWEFKSRPKQPPPGIPTREDIKTKSQIEDERNPFLQDIKRQRKEQGIKRLKSN